MNGADHVSLHISLAIGESSPTDMQWVEQIQQLRGKLEQTLRERDEAQRKAKQVDSLLPQIEQLNAWLAEHEPAYFQNPYTNTAEDILLADIIDDRQIESETTP